MRLKVKTTKTHQLFFFSRLQLFFKIQFNWSAKVFRTSNSDFKENFIHEITRSAFFYLIFLLTLKALSFVT